MKVERADFDDLVTLVTSAPTWEKDRLAGIRILLRAIGEEKADAPEQILSRWTWKLARATRKVQDRRASSEFPEAKRLLGALANSRGHRHEENAAKLVNAALEQPLNVGVALLASAEGYTPRANQLHRRSARAARARSRRSRTRSRTTCPRRRPPSPAARAAAAQEARARGRPAQPRRAEAPEEPQVVQRRATQQPEDRRGRTSRSALPKHREVRASDGRRHRLRPLSQGSITAISPCVLPVLPILLAGGASGGRRRPYAIIAGLVVTFLVSILFATWILDQLGLPDDLLRNISIALLFVIAATLIFPQFGVLIERPLSRLSRRPSSDLGGGFLLGCALGFVFVPAAGRRSRS